MSTSSIQAVTCPHCRAEVGYLPQYASQVVGCPHCSGQFQMPQLGPAAQTSAYLPASPPITTNAHARRGRLESKQPPKNPGVAAVLSFFFPGVGQIYNGQFLKGFLVNIFVLLGLFLFILLLPPVLSLMLWGWSILDAYLTAEQWNRRRC